MGKDKESYYHLLKTAEKSNEPCEEAYLDMNTEDGYGTVAISNANIAGNAKIYTFP